MPPPRRASEIRPLTVVFPFPQLLKWTKPLLADCILTLDIRNAHRSGKKEAIVDNIIRLHELEKDRLMDDRAVSLPSHTVSVQDMIDALHAAAVHRSLGQITVNPDPFIEQICAGWPQECEHSLATSLGFTKEDALEEIVSYYIEDYL